MGERRERWDDDPVGDYDSGTGLRRRWRRGGNQYLAVLLGLVGAFVLVGAVPRGAVSGTLAGCCLLGASFAIVRADGPRPTMRRPAPRIPTLRVELAWYAAATVLALAGTVLLTL